MKSQALFQISFTNEIKHLEEAPKCLILNDKRIRLRVYNIQQVRPVSSFPAWRDRRYT